MELEILISVIMWTAITLLFSLKDKTVEDIRIRFSIMMLCCVVTNYFINVI